MLIYEFRNRVLRRGWQVTVILTLASFGLILYPFLVLVGKKRSTIYLFFWAAVGLWKLIRELRPGHMELIQQNYLTRKLRLNALIQDFQRQRVMRTEEIQRFRGETLALIASYVRDHRLDKKGTQIFANLLIEDGDDLLVVARDQPHRQASAKYPKAKLLAWTALSSGIPQSTGDVYEDYPGTPEGKPYRSILVIPVRLGDRVVGVVSIDSSRRYHFELYADELVQGLTPFVSLLAWTLDEPALMARAPGGGS